MPRIPRSTIEQWAVLRTVVEQAGFANAANVLNRSQSSVSYAVARLQEALGVELIEIEGRRAVLTEVGASLLADAIPLIDELTLLETHAKAIAGGEILKIHLVIDCLLPKSLLFQALKALAKCHPHVEVHLRETVRLMPDEVRSNEDFDLAVLRTNLSSSDSLPMVGITLVGVVCADHTLNRDPNTLTRTDLSRHPRVEILGMEIAQSTHEEHGQVWRMKTVETAIEAVRQGLCYGWLPSHLITEDIKAGRLVPLPLKVGSTRHIPLSLYFGTGAIQDSPAIRFLSGLLTTTDEC